MVAWQVPYGMSGDDTLLRFRPSSFRNHRNGCPQKAALKARPGLSRRDPQAGPARSGVETYGLGPLDEVLDLHEFDGLSVEAAFSRWRDRPRRAPHPALIPWTDHAVRGYVAASARISGGIPMAPLSRAWARQRFVSEDGTMAVWEETATGRRYVGDGLRELRFSRPESVLNRPRDETEITVAAAVLAAGRPVLNRFSRGKRFALGRFERPEHVRIIEIGCVDGSVNVLFDGSPEAALARYDDDVCAKLRSVASGGAYRPGHDCLGCPLLGACPAVPNRPGLFGVDDVSRPLRSWSISTSRSHETCGPRPHFRDLHLPGNHVVEESAATIRGRAVHDRIESLHRRTPPRPCTADDAPDSPSVWLDKSSSSDVRQARLGIQMVGDHSLVCPLKDTDLEEAEILPEHSVAVFDPAANVVVIAKVDLLYRVSGAWSLRETKTSEQVNEDDLLKRFPQISLALMLSAEGALAGGPAGCRVELERLTATGPVLSVFSSHDPEFVAEAHEVVRTRFARWHADVELKTRPGKACRTCAFTRWCPDAVTKEEK